MSGTVRTSIGPYERSGSNSIVEQTTDIINRFRKSIVRSRKERLLDEDIQATENIVDQLHLTQLITKETLGKLILQGDSIQRSYGLINQLEKEIKDIAEDLNEVNGGKCWGAWTNETFFGFTCFGCFKKKKKKKNRRKPYQQTVSNQSKPIEQNFDRLDQTRWSSVTEREEMISKIRGLSRERRENPDFIDTMNQLNDIKSKETENNEKKFNDYRDYLLQNHSLSYGYIDQPDRLINEMNMSIQFNQLNTYLNHLLEMTNTITNEINEHNILISKIETQAMESGNLLTDYTLLGHHILDSSSSPSQTLTNTNTISPNLNQLAIANGQKVLLNSIL